MGKIIQRLLAISKLELANDDLIPVQDVSEPKTKAIQISELKKAMVDAMYPVGSVYINASDGTNPGTLFGVGTWVAHGTGRVNVAIDTSQTEFDTIGETGGHKLLQAHTHANTWRVFMPSGTGSLGLNDRGGDGILVSDNASHGGNGEDRSGNPSVVQSAGGGNSQNLQPYIVVYSWKRTA